MQIYTFYQLFGFKPNGMLYTKVDVRIGNFTLHAGAEINRGVTIDGIDLFAWQGRNLQVQVVGTTYILKGVQNG